MKADKSHNKPFKLENISKEQSFSVPDGYFDKLPTIIQAKALDSTRKKTLLAPIGLLRLAMPSLLLIIVAGYFGYKYVNNSNDSDAKIELMLAEVSTEEMVNFLDQTELTSEDLLNLVSFEGERIDDFSDDLENVSDEELELLINDFEIEDINNI